VSAISTNRPAFYIVPKLARAYRARAASLCIISAGDVSAGKALANELFEHRKVAFNKRSVARHFGMAGFRFGGIGACHRICCDSETRASDTQD